MQDSVAFGTHKYRRVGAPGTTKMFTLNLNYCTNVKPRMFVLLVRTGRLLCRGEICQCPVLELQHNGSGNSRRDWCTTRLSHVPMLTAGNEKKFWTVRFDPQQLVCRGWLRLLCQCLLCCTCAAYTRSSLLTNAAPLRLEPWHCV